MKKCITCKKDFPDEEFNKNKTRKDGLGNVCKPCRKEYDKNRYNNNKAYTKEGNNRRRKDNRDWFLDIKKDLRCEKCGEDFIYCLEFHHKDPKEKEMNISVMVGQAYGKERIKKEINKCIVLCANCHRKEHYAGLDQLVEQES